MARQVLPVLSAFPVPGRGPGAGVLEPPRRSGRPAIQRGAVHRERHLPRTGRDLSLWTPRLVSFAWSRNRNFFIGHSPRKARPSTAPYHKKIAPLPEERGDMDL